MTSQLKTVFLLGLLTGIILLFGRMLGGQGGLIIAFVIAMVMNVGSYWFSSKIVLAMYRAQELAPMDAPSLHSMVEEMAAKAGIPKPRIYLIPEETPNAFATGRNPENGVVAVTQGILHTLSPEELKGVLAHELGHIKNRDILIQTVAATLASVIMFVANTMRFAAIFGSSRDNDRGNPMMAMVLAIIAPFAAMLIQMAISRSREYLADDTGAHLAGNPLYLASALGKLEERSLQLKMHHGTPATAHMFIVNPFRNMSFSSLFSTHPPIAERIRRLREMAGSR